MCANEATQTTRGRSGGCQGCQRNVQLLAWEGHVNRCYSVIHMPQFSGISGASSSCSRLRKEARQAGACAVTSAYRSASCQPSRRRQRQVACGAVHQVAQCRMIRTRGLRGEQQEGRTAKEEALLPRFDFASVAASDPTGVLRQEIAGSDMACVLKHRPSTPACALPGPQMWAPATA
jgi:hypothetical protein